MVEFYIYGSWPVYYIDISQWIDVAEPYTTSKT